MNRGLTYAVGALIFILLTGGAFRPGTAGRPPRPDVGFPAPEFDLRDVAGNRVQLADYRGKPVLLNFWATWCPPCKAEMPEIQKLVQRHPDLVVLGMDFGHTERSPQAVADFIRAGGYTWQVPFDADGQVSARYGVISIPTSFFIDAQGIIRSKFLGPMSLPLMEDLANQVLPRG